MKSILVILLSLLVLSAGHAAESSSENCAIQTDAKKRLACYDRKGKAPKVEISPFNPRSTLVFVDVINVDKCKADAFIARQEYLIAKGRTASNSDAMTDAYRKVRNCTSDYLDKAQKEYVIASENVVDKPEALRLLKEFYATWQTRVQSNYYILDSARDYEAKNDAVNSKLNELRNRLNLELPYNGPR